MGESNIPIHGRENNEESQNHLDGNRQEFQNQCLRVLKILMTGERLTAKTLSQKYDIADGGRRLRDLFAEGKYNVKREWVLDAAGKKTRFKEYFLEITTRPTKEQVINRFKNGDFIQGELL